MAHTITGLDVYSISTPIPNPVSDSSFTIPSAGMIVVRVTTSEGLSGYGTTFSVSVPTSVPEFILKTIKPVVIGKDPHAFTDIWNAMFSAVRSVGRKGFAFSALSAVDIAIWDLRGKILGLPVFRMLGGTKRQIPTYASGGWLSWTLDETIDIMKGWVNDGYFLVKMKVGIEGGRNLKGDARRVEAIRKAIGDDVGLLVDANGIWSSADAIRFADMIKEYNILVYEEPCTADDIAGLRRVREMTGLPIGTGENEYTKYGMRDLALGEAVDVVQLDVTRAGGFTEMMKVAAIAEAWNLQLAPHAWEGISAHLLSAVSNGLFLEKLDSTQELIFKKAVHDFPLPKNGLYEIPDLPGLGLNFDQEYLESSSIV